ncbi:hypothetical protein NPX13_g7022 [Xylaria arbuscula]|uniref:Uncharacterized protein n=1 Tax=Xylaria arbuscula TaxID=114810 RepID=A0A9W8TKV0_9PEZI|nr:hypothetical protein NPX13_g7022 [Xylaria arbuscula]
MWCLMLGKLHDSTYRHQQTKGDEPGDRNEEVEGIVDEARREGDQPDERKENGNAGNDFGVYETSLAPARRILHMVEVVPVDTRDDGSEHKLRDAEDDGGETGQDHVCGVGRLLFCVTRYDLERSSKPLAAGRQLV